jgi:hypothetical protein
MPPPSKKKLYIGCAINNLPDDKKDEFLKMIAGLKKKLSKKFKILDFMGALKKDASPEETYWRDIHECVGTADIMVAICDYPSTGLGYEMAVAIEQRGIPVLALAQYSSKVSNLIPGIHGREKKKKYWFTRYRTIEQIPEIIETCFAVRELMDRKR